MNELRDIEGYEGLYAVTATGEVWAYPRTWLSGRRQSHRRERPGFWLKSSMRGKYLAVCLTKDGREQTHNLHRLVAKAWVPNPRGLPQVNHLDGVKTRNVAVNLEWTTAEENTRHAWANGLSRVTEKMREHGRNLPRPVAKTHCKRGHSLSGENVIHRPNGRACRECQRMHSRKYRRAARARAHPVQAQEPGGVGEAANI